MKNNGLLKLFLVLAFCGVLSVYALTEGSIERLELDAKRVADISYVDYAFSENSARITEPGYIAQLTDEINRMEFRKTYFKLSQEDIEQLKMIAIVCGDAFEGEDIEFTSIMLLSDKRVLLVQEDKLDGCYIADYESLENMVAELARKTMEQDPYTGIGWYLAVSEDMLE